MAYLNKEKKLRGNIEWAGYDRGKHRIKCQGSQLQQGRLRLNPKGKGLVVRADNKQHVCLQQEFSIKIQKFWACIHQIT